MLSTPLNELIPVLQVAIGPVILISGISLLLLTLTNRFGRTIDRSRQLVHEMRESTTRDHQLAGQIEILYRRARLTRLSIISAAAGLLLASSLIIALFVAALMKWEASVFIGIFFVSCMLSLIVSLVAFMKDIQLSLAALALELGKTPSGGKVRCPDAGERMKSIRFLMRRRKDALLCFGDESDDSNLCASRISGANTV